MSGRIKPQIARFAMALLLLVATVGTAASAKQRYHHADDRSSGYGAARVGAAAHPNEDLIIRHPNGAYTGTDPDAGVRGSMRRDNIATSAGGSPM